MHPDETTTETLQNQLKERIRSIRKEAEGLTEVMWSEAELMQNHHQLNSFHQAIQKMMTDILKNIDLYHKRMWKKLVPNREILEIKEKEERISNEKKRLQEWFQWHFRITGFYLSFKSLLPESTFVKHVSKLGADGLRHARILDVGCGDGYWLRKLADWGAVPERLTGIEFAPPLLELARTSSPQGIRFVKAEPGELPLVESGKFDVILLFGLLMYILDDHLRKNIGQELLQILNDGGMIIATNLLKDAERELEPYAATGAKGLGIDELKDIFPKCQIEFEESSQYGLAVIRKNG